MLPRMTFVCDGAVMLIVMSFRIPRRWVLLAESERCISKLPHQHLSIPNSTPQYVRVPQPHGLSFGSLIEDD